MYGIIVYWRLVLNKIVDKNCLWKYDLWMTLIGHCLNSEEKHFYIVKSNSIWKTTLWSIHCFEKRSNSNYSAQSQLGFDPIANEENTHQVSMYAREIQGGIYNRTQRDKIETCLCMYVCFKLYLCILILHVHTYVHE